VGREQVVGRRRRGGGNKRIPSLKIKRKGRPRLTKGVSRLGPPKETARAGQERANPPQKEKERRREKKEKKRKGEKESCDSA